MVLLHLGVIHLCFRYVSIEDWNWGKEYELYQPSCKHGCAEKDWVACPDVLILHLLLCKWGFNYLARERWGFITIPPGNGGANGVACRISPLRRGCLITWWISENRSIVKHATLSTLSPICGEARLTAADSQAFWIAAGVCVCVCLTILNITTGTTNGARKTRRTHCSPGVAEIHTSKAGEARLLPNRSCSAVTFTPFTSFPASWSCTGKMFS